MVQLPIVDIFYTYVAMEEKPLPAIQQQLASLGSLIPENQYYK
jgi:hypothetical protein